MSVEQFEQLVEDYIAGINWPGMAAVIGVSGWMLQRWVRSRPEVYTIFREAKKLKAERMVDETIEIADERITFSEEVSRNALRVKARQWIASRLDPEAFGTNKKGSINIGALFLSAMREINEPETKARIAAMEAQRESLPAEIVTDTDPDEEAAPALEGEDVGDIL